MIGPVLYQEMLLGGRRSRTHVFRWIYATWLLVWLVLYFLFALMQVGMIERRQADMTDLAGFAQRFSGLLLVQHFLVLILATPVFTAGAIADEKWRGTLQHLLTADLFPYEILVGKLIGRSYQVLLLALPALPLLAFLGGFSGLNPFGYLALAVHSGLVVFGLGGASLLASVWCRRTSQAVIGLFTIALLALVGLQQLRHLLAGVGLFAWLGNLLEIYQPTALAEAVWSEAAGQTLLASATAWGGLGAVCLALAAWRLRPAYIRQLEGTSKARQHWWLARRSRMGNDPIRWKERQVEGIAPLAILRLLPTWLGVLSLFAITVLSSVWILVDHLPTGTSLATVWRLMRTLDLDGLAGVAAGLFPCESAFFRQGMVVMFIASLVVGIRCSGAVVGERERQTWEPLLLTPLPTRQLVRGKLWGIAGAAVPYLLAYAVPALLLSLIAGPVSALWTLLWLGVTCLACFYTGAAGLWCSVRSLTSWRSLLGTLGFAYGAGFVLAFCSAFAAVFVSMLLIALYLLLLRYVGRNAAQSVLNSFDAFSLAFWILMGLCFFFLAWLLMRTAETWVTLRERTRQWRDKALPRRRRRRAPVEG